MANLHHPGKRWAPVMHLSKEGNDLKRVACLCVCSLVLLIALAACAPPLPAAVASAPPTSAVTAEQWAERYPMEYAQWAASVHGVAYLAGDMAAPGCTGCHGDPAGGETRTVPFRLNIPARCGRCHADQQVTAKHGLPNDTYESYLKTFHGATVAYYRATDPAAERYEAVCSDCHAAHAIHAPSDARSSVAPANLLRACVKCHQGAGPAFATTADGHFRTDRTASPLLYVLELVYRIGIPLIIGAMLLYILLDILHRVRSRAGGGNQS